MSQPPDFSQFAPRFDDRAPIGIEASSDAQWLALWTTGFVALGVLVRVIRYLLNYPLWCDETMLAANFLDRGYFDLLGTLDYRQACPVLFLFVELTAVKLLGFSEQSLRLFPLLCSVSSVILFRHVAGRLLKGEALVCAVAILAVSNWPLKYAGEVKPYASDLLVALGLLALAVEWWRRPDRVGYLWGLAALGPIAVGLSFPAIFVAGGVSLALLWEIWRTRRRLAWLPYVIYNVVIGATFLLTLRVSRLAPNDLDYFHRDWASAFPPLNNLGKLVVWFFANNTGFMFAYPEGGANGASVLTFIAFVVACVVFWRRGRSMVLALCLAPFGLGLVAAALHRYPYGMNARTMQYLAPAICLYAGLGSAALIARIRPSDTRRNVQRGFLGLLVVLALGRMAFDISYPYRALEDQRHREFAQWFWREQSRDAELICPKIDLGLDFVPEHWGKDATDSYRCYQRLYSARHAMGNSPRFDRISTGRQLRFVFFNEIPENEPAARAWLAEMSKSYTLVKHESFPITAPAHSKTAFDTLYLTYDFVPKPGTMIADLPRIGERTKAALREGESKTR